MSEKCKIKMGDKRLPVDGSAQGEPHKATGTCPECLTPGVALSIVGGFVRAHVIADRAMPENSQIVTAVVDKSVRRDRSGRVLKVGTGLSEPQVELTDTGVRVGDPRGAEKRRAAMLAGATGTGTVKVRRKVDSGKTLNSGAPKMTWKMVDVPATEAHVREALDYWRTKRITERTPDSVRRAQVENVSTLARMLESILAAQDVRWDRAAGGLVTSPRPVAQQMEFRAETDRALVHRGPTLVRGRAMEADTLTATALRAVETGRKNDKPVRPSCDGPLGRERADKRITTVPEPAPVLSASQKRRMRRNKCRKAHQATAAK